LTKAKRTPEYLEKISFKNLVKAIDKKWSHTYIDVKVEDKDISNIFDNFEQETQS